MPFGADCRRLVLIGAFANSRMPPAILKKVILASVGSNKNDGSDGFG